MGGGLPRAPRTPATRWLVSAHAPNPFGRFRLGRIVQSSAQPPSENVEEVGTIIDPNQRSVHTATFIHSGGTTRTNWGLASQLTGHVMATIALRASKELMIMGAESERPVQPDTDTADSSRKLSVRQAAFIGVGSMVGAGIFALLGATGEVAGSAVWISFLLAGVVAALQGYSFAKLGARYPSAGGFLEYVIRGWGDGHLTGVVAWMLLAVNAIITAMVAVSFGSYASDAVANDAHWTKPFAVLVLLVMTALNVVGSQAVARVQTVVVVVVVGILALFSVATLSTLHP